MKKAILILLFLKSFLLADYSLEVFNTNGSTFKTFSCIEDNFYFYDVLLQCFE